VALSDEFDAADGERRLSVSWGITFLSVRNLVDVKMVWDEKARGE